MDCVLCSLLVLVRTGETNEISTSTKKNVSCSCAYACAYFTSVNKPGKELVIAFCDWLRTLCLFYINVCPVHTTK